MARNGQFDRLLEYCQDDVRILVDLYRKRHLVHPRNRTISMDMKSIVREGLYEEWEEHDARTAAEYAAQSKPQIQQPSVPYMQEPTVLTTSNVLRLAFAFWREHKEETGNDFEMVLCHMLDARDDNNNACFVMSSSDECSLANKFHDHVWNYSVWKDLPYLSYKQTRQHLMKKDNTVFRERHAQWVREWSK